ncbi:MAG: dihydropteroate synthase [Candidatus Malihini olakiniferum]
MKLISRDAILDLTHPQVMGVLNVTPDSFSDGGKYITLAEAIRHAQEMVNAGATLIDIGGESTRPGAEDVNLQEELDRVIPVVEALAARFDIWLSVDTSKPDVIIAAARAGAHLINDIRSLQEPGALEATAATGLPICLMHMQGKPKTMQYNPHYDNVVAEVNAYFHQQVARCTEGGIEKYHLLLDPGFGFGKNLSHNYRLLAHLQEFHHFGLPLLVGLSRKFMIGQLLNIPPLQRGYGSVACAVIAALQGAHIIRVHDVKATVDAIRIVKATLAEKE